MRRFHVYDNVTRRLLVSTEHFLNTLQYEVFVFVVRHIFTRDFQNRRNGLRVILDQIPDLLSQVLRNQQNANVAARCKFAEFRRNFIVFGFFGIDHEPIGLVATALISVSNTGKQEAGNRIFVANDGNKAGSSLFYLFYER